MDARKIIRGALANPLIRIISENLLKNTNFQLKFPFKPVSQFQEIVWKKSTKIFIPREIMKLEIFHLLTSLFCIRFLHHTKLR